MSIFSLFCRHSWDTLVEEKTKSQIEILEEKDLKVPFPANNYQLDSMTKHFYINIFACNKCGKIKKFKTSSV